MKSSVFWDITQCSPLKVHRRFGGTCHLHLQGQIISQARYQVVACFHAGFLHGLFFDPEDGGDMFLRMSVDFKRTTRRYIPEDRALHDKVVLLKKSAAEFVEYCGFNSACFCI
jgi:hypothetical protein